MAVVNPRLGELSKKNEVERISDALAARKANGHTLGRPPNVKRISQIATMRRKHSVSEIAGKLDCTRANVYAALAQGKRIASVNG